ncbi:MAG: hypothetical protein MOB07_14140 [Acidobacteria bacterium]|nr:hypothetical protein [Acidobacteriota bacterium]
MNRRSSSKKRVPFSFVLEELDSLDPLVKPMFGCFSVYIGDKIVLFLCELERHPYQKGVWVATTPEHYRSLALEFSSTRSVEHPRIGKSPWLLLPAGAGDFEEQALRACQLILSGDPRIGRVPKRKRLKPGKSNL